MIISLCSLFFIIFAVLFFHAHFFAIYLICFSFIATHSRHSINLQFPFISQGWHPHIVCNTIIEPSIDDWRDHCAEMKSAKHTETGYEERRRNDKEYRNKNKRIKIRRKRRERESSRKTMYHIRYLLQQFI